MAFLSKLQKISTCIFCVYAADIEDDSTSDGFLPVYIVSLVTSNDEIDNSNLMLGIEQDGHISPY